MSSARVVKTLVEDWCKSDYTFTAHCATEDKFFEGHHVRRCPIFGPKSDEDKKKGHITSADVQILAQKSGEEQKKKKKKRSSRP